MMFVLEPPGDNSAWSEVIRLPRITETTWWRGRRMPRRVALGLALIAVVLVLVGAWLVPPGDHAVHPQLREVSLVARFEPLAPPGLPAYMAVQPSGFLLVGDRAHHSIRVLDHDAKPVGTWGPAFAPGESLFDVGGIAISGPSVYVVDPASKRIAHLDAMGRWLGEISFGSIDTYGAGALAVDGSGKLYLADTGHGRILVLGASGALLRTLGAPGAARGELKQPVALAFGPDGALYVADLENERIGWWDSTLNPAGEWGVGFAPFGVAVDSLGRVLVPNVNTRMVLAYSSSGRPLGELDERVPSGEVLSFPNQIALGSDADSMWLLGQDGLMRLVLEPQTTPAAETPWQSLPMRAAVGGAGLVVVAAAALAGIRRVVRTPRAQPKLLRRTFARLSLAESVRWGAVVWSVALLAAAGAQAAFDLGSGLEQARPLHLAAFGLALIGAVFLPVPRLAKPGPAASDRRTHLSRRGLGLASIGAAVVLGSIPLEANARYQAAVLVWLIGLGLVVAGSVEFRPATWRRPRLWSIDMAVPLAITALAFVLRVLDLAQVPPNVHGDEGAVGIEARKLLSSQVHDLFGLGWFEIPNFSFALQAIFMLLFGDNLLGMRLASATYGTLSVLFTYLLTRRLFGTRVAVIAACLLVGAEMHVHYSRIGIIYMQAGLVTVLLLYLLMRALEHGRLVDYVLLGLGGGLSLLVYAVARLAPVLVVAYLLHAFARDRSFLRTHLPGVCAAGMAGLLFIVPMAVTYVAHPDAINSRTSDISVLGGEGLKHELSAYGVTSVKDVLLIQTQRTFEGILYTGESGLQYGHRAPLVDPWTSALLVCGVGAFALRFLNPSMFLLAMWLWLSLLLGSILTVDAPFSPHMVGMLPLFAIYPALFLDAGWRTAARLAGRAATVVFAAVAAAVVVLALVANVRDYTQVQVVTRQPAGFATVLGRYLESSIGNHYRVYLISRPDTFLRYDSTRFLAPDLDGIDLHDGPLVVQPPDPGKGLAFIVEASMPAASERVVEVQRRYPAARVEQHRATSGDLLFTSILVDPV